MLTVNDLTKRFALPTAFGKKREFLTALDAVSFSVKEGRTLGVVGPSGCGKTTLARVIMGEYAPDEGSVRLGGFIAPTRHARSRLVSMVFQDPYGAMDPRQRVSDILDEAMTTLGVNERAREERAIYAMRKVNLPLTFLERYPHELSGGQRQRVCIAAALAQSVRLLVLDEPTSALDAATTAEIIALLGRLQDDDGLTYLLISHDLRTVGALAHEVAVMEQGRIVERGEARKILSSPITAAAQELVAASAYRDII
jgi:ABC-type glutathione transport system ATPase component